MKILNQLAIILGLWALGEYISSFIQSVVVIPGSIIDLISDNIFVLLITIFVSTIIVMYISGKLVEIMINKRTKEN